MIKCRLAVVVVLIFSVPARADCLMEFLSQWGGTTSAIDVRGHFACIGVGPNLETVSFQNPAVPQRLGRILLSTGVRRVAIENDIAYVVTDRLELVDISDPPVPTRIAEFIPPERITDIAVRDEFVYLATVAGFVVVDASDREHPTSIWVEPQTNAGPSSSIMLHGPYAVMTNDFCGLRIFEVSDPAAPILLSECVVTIRGPLFAVDEYVYGMGMHGEVHAVDVSDPTSPVVAGSAPNPHAFLGLLARVENRIATRVWINPAYGIQMFDISDRIRPVAIGPPVPLGSISDDAASAGGLIYVADRSGAITVWQGDAAPLSLVGTLPIHEGNVSAAWLRPYALVASGEGGLRVMEVPEDGGLLEIAVLAGGDYAGTVVTDGNYAFVATRPSGFYVAEFEDPLQPRILARLALNGRSVHAMTIEDGHLYVADSAGRVHIFDLARPDAPTELGVAENVGYAHELAVRDRIAYLTTGLTLSVVDCRVPSAPYLISRYEFDSYSNGLTLWNDKVLAALYPSGGEIVDVSDPAHPRSDGGIWCSTGSVDYATQGDALYAQCPRGTLAWLEGSTRWDLEEIDRVSVPGSVYRFVPGPGKMLVELGNDGLAVVRTGLRGDTNSDGDIDLADLAKLLGRFGSTSGATITDGDTDCDGDVDLNDLEALLRGFGRRH